MEDLNNLDINMQDMKDKMKELDKCISMMYHTYHECPIPDDFEQLIDKRRKYLMSRKIEE